MSKPQEGVHRSSVRLPVEYKRGHKIGAGSFGDVYIATDLTTGEDVAAKAEPINSKYPQLKNEARIYHLLAGGSGIPRVRYCGSEGDYNIIILDLLGRTLEDQFYHCGRSFPLKTVLLLADQLLGLAEFIHSRSVVSRDIKPENFLLGLGERANVVHMIDFGLAQRYRDPVTLQHYPYKDKLNLAGTARYASVNTHLGIEQSRRDDLESLGYVLLYFMRGTLPWQGLKVDNKMHKYAKILQIKRETPVEDLCAGLPAAFCTYVTYTRALQFDETPDYGHLRGLFRQLLAAQGASPGDVLEWPSKTKSGPTQSSPMQKTELSIRTTPNVGDPMQQD